MEPPTTDVSAPFWAATREQRLELPWCTKCEEPIWCPREVCPGCLGTSIEWRPAAGTGTVYAVTVDHKPQNPGMAGWAPYAVALVDLDEGVRFLTNVVGCPPDDVVVGMPVEVTWEALPDGRQLPLFRPREVRAPDAAGARG
ncbi:MAG: OB-fold domain-containing protein [Actinobacteria bacterium]|nr:OB-fold domain-containing protein [Actinomycetota bacterium]